MPAVIPNIINNVHFDGAKAPRLNDHKSVNISNINRLMIVQARELSLASKCTLFMIFGINTDAMFVHLEPISLKIPEGRHAVIVLDRAAWHTTKRLRKFSNISLLPLPLPSPELNRTEQVLQVLRDEHLANRHYENYDAIMDACCDAWNVFVDSPNRVKNLC